MLVERITLSAGDPDAPARVAAGLRASVAGVEGVEAAVASIVADVPAKGDEAVREYTRRFDTGGEQPRELCVPAHELDEALERMPLDVVAGLQVAIAN